MNLIEIAVPDIGDFDEVEVIEVLVKPGDDISVEQSLITVESDKASMEIPSSAAGKLQALKVKVGDKVTKGSVIGTLESGSAAPSASTPAASASSAPASPAAAAKAPASSPPPVSAPASPAGKASGTGGGGGTTEVQVPDIGDFDEVEVIEILVAVGDRVEVEQSLITVESDKASMEIPSSVAGTVSKLQVRIGDKVAKGTAVATVEVDGTGAGQEAAAATAPSPASAPVSAPPAGATSQAATPQTAETTAPQAAGAGARSRVAAAESPLSQEASRSHPVPADMRSGTIAMKPHASPSVRLFARELGVELSRVKGTGPKERITTDDVKAFVKDAVAQGPDAAASVGAGGAGGAGLGLIAWPKVDFSRYGEIETKPLARIKKIAAANLHRNWVMIPHVTNHDDADITDLEAFRVTLNAENAKGGVKLTMLAFLIKACIAALRKFPEFNTSLEGESLVYKRYYHIGFAADTPNGLVVPVIKDADKKGLFDIAAEMAELAAKARDGKLGPADMQGGTFSISSLGGIGGTYFTPIINAPEVAILGVCRSSRRAVWNDKTGAFEPRLILPLSLSWDHRVIDGASAARFNTYLTQVLGDFRRVIL